MRNIFLFPAVLCIQLLFSQQSMADQTNEKPPGTMTKMVVRLMGPDIRPGSYSALPKTIYRAGAHYARIEDAPDAKQKMQKLTVIVEPDAYSANLIDKTGTHAIDQGGVNDLHLPIVLPLDPKHKLGNLDRIEFGDEAEFFEAARAEKQAGPVINSKATDAFVLKSSEGSATLVLRGGTETPVSLSWQTPEGTYKYEYISYEDVPFQADLFAKPRGISFKEIPPDPDVASRTNK